MREFTVARMRADAASIFGSAVASVDAQECVKRFVKLQGRALRIGGVDYNLESFERVLVVGTGKASPRMGVALEEELGDRISDGVINTKYAHAEPLRRIRTVECGHPVPDEAGVEGTREILAALEGADDRTLVICLISGGGSALMPAPSEGHYAAGETGHNPAAARVRRQYRGAECGPQTSVPREGRGSRPDGVSGHDRVPYVVGRHR